MSKVSLKTIAAHLGVSTALVSYVLNGKAKEARVSDTMAEKIRKAALDLNYQPNLLAKGLKSGSSKTLGLIVADISNPFFSTLGRLMEDLAQQEGYTLLFGSSDENAGRQQALINAFLNRQVDGLLIAPAEGTVGQLQSLQQRQIPFVLVDRYFPGLPAYQVHLNNQEASREAVNHLLALGHRRLGLVYWAHELAHMKDRKQGFLSALAASGLKTPKNHLPAIRYDRVDADLPMALEKMFSGRQPPTALLFATNSLAVQGIKILEAMGMIIPDQLAIISFDQSDAFDFYHSPITYVDQQLPLMASEAMRLLLHQIQSGDAEGERVLIPPVLVVRKSSGQGVSLR